MFLKIEDILKFKMFLFCSNQVELVVFTYTAYLKNETISSVRSVYLIVVK